MSCSCNSDCNPCAQVSSTQESVASWLDNLTLTLLGEFTKTIVNGRATWAAPCDLYSTGLECYPKLTDEGWICYLIRLMDLIGVFVGGTWNPATAYCKNTFVTYGSVSYVALAAVPAGAGTPETRPDLWLAVAGPGPQGPPGPSGAGSAVNYAYRTLVASDTLTDSDAVVFCEPAAAIVVTLPLIATTLPGKWFHIWTNGAFNVQLQITGGDTLQVGPTIGASYNLTTPGEAIKLVSNPATNKWVTV